MLTARKLRRHLNAEILARAAPAPLWVAAGVFAAWRLLAGRAVLPVGAALLATALVAIAVRFRRRAWSEGQARVALDRSAGTGGLLLALHERPSPPWQAELERRLASATLPRRQLRQPSLAAILALLFAAAAALVPLPAAVAHPAQAAALTEVEQAQAKAEALAAENALDPQLAEELERLRQEAEAGRFDAADWAALDSVTDALEADGAQRDSELAAAEAAAEKLAQALEQNATEEAERRAAEELEQAMAQLGQEGDAQQGQGQQGEQGAEGQARQTPQSAAQARAMQKALEARRQAMAKGTQQGQKGPPSDQNGQGQSGLQPAEGEGECPPGMTCKGGPSRGGGAAPVTFGEPTEVHAEELQIAPLESQEKGNLDQMLGITASQPKPGDPAALPGLSGQPSGPEGVGPRAAPVAPRHRGVLKRYFDKQPGAPR